MKKEKTIKKNYYIRRIIRKGKKAQNDVYQGAYFRNRYNENRLAIIVGKFLGNSVVRNRQKRLLREANRLINSKTKKGFDIVLRVKKNVSNIYESLDMLKDIYQKLEIYEENTYTYD